MHEVKLVYQNNYYIGIQNLQLGLTETAVYDAMTKDGWNCALP